MKNKKKTLIIIGTVLLFLFSIFIWFYVRNESLKTGINYTLQTDYVSNPAYYTYRGEEGKNALTLLKEKTRVKQGSSGLVISINARRAKEDKKEFWAFYINGKMAEVGPGNYQTKEGDIIEWKIEKY
jgi:hypothetical protein